MNKGLNILIGLISLLLLVLGLKTMFDPTSMIEKWGMDPIGLTGLNSLRSMFAGVLVGGALMMQLGIWKKNTTWFLAAAVLMAVIAFGRILSFALDGYDHASLPPTVVELFALVVLVFADRKMASKDAE
jgi:uncharacterized membrane protein YoaK (UPF0700 family)